MKRNMKSVLALAGIVGVLAVQAMAGWDKAGVYSVSGSDSAEVRIGAASVSEIRFICTRGNITIKSILVKTGQGEATIDVNERMSEGDTKDVSLRYHLGIRGLTVSHEGSGQYQVDLQ